MTHPVRGALGAGEHHITLLPTRASITAATAVPISTTAATGAPLLPRPGLVDCYGASAEFLAIECVDCSLSFCTGRHFNKGEPFGAACIAITDHMDRVIAWRIHQVAYVLNL